MIDLAIPRIYGSTATDSSKRFPPDICGPTAFDTQQLLITAYAPRISVISTDGADSIAKSCSGNIKNARHLLSFFENIFAYGSGYNESVTSNIGTSTTSLSGSGCVRFVDNTISDLKQPSSKAQEELYDLDLLNNLFEQYICTINAQLHLLNNLELDNTTYQNEYRTVCSLQNSIYIKLLSLMNASSKISSFECFNHPVMHLMVVSGNDDLEEIKQLTSAFKDLPAWFDSSSVLKSYFILVDQDDSVMLQNALRIQEDMKIKMGIRSTIASIKTAVLTEESMKATSTETELIRLYPSFFEIDQEGSEAETMILERQVFESWKKPLQEVISKDLVLFMNSRIKQWNEEFVAPRTSLAGKLFGNRKWSNNKSSFFSFGKDSEKNTENSLDVSYNSTGGYYLANSPEMNLRKLGDWYFMLGDYKNANLTYELVKKDMLRDKAHLHLASLQEAIIQSLLLGSGTKVHQQQVTPKLISSVIAPMVDSSFYSYLSRSNLKTFTLRFIISCAEIYFLIGQTTACCVSTGELPPGSPSSDIYFTEAINLFRKVIDSKLLKKTATAFLMQRIAYIYFCYDKPATTKKDSLSLSHNSYYESENENKLCVSTHSIGNFGIPKTRRLVFWMLLAAKELDPNLQPLQAKIMIWRINEQLREDSSDGKTVIWLEKEGGLYHRLKKQLDLI